MPLLEAADGEMMQAGHVYVTPPDATLTVSDGALRVTKPAPPRQHHWPIDALFTSLAEEYGDLAVCVMLSGSGSDGARGLRVVKEHGGLTLVQADSDEVATPGMPAAAGPTDLADQVLPVAGTNPARTQRGCMLQTRRWRIGKNSSRPRQGLQRHA
jgi:two-component system CheB/CheR fusion protein